MEQVYQEENRVKEEYDDIVLKNAWPLVYQRIGFECQRFGYTWNEAKKARNKPLNRYRDVNPFDHTRVILNRSPIDYINANFVTMERANRRYILTQGPLAFTVGHFWLMIWEQNTKAILMLNKVIEKNEVKCHWYWPDEVGEHNTLTYDDVGLSVTLVNEEDCNYYSTRLFKLYDDHSKTYKNVMQYHYTTWPDFGVPTSSNAFLQFLKRVRESGVFDPTDGPPVIHCSAGIGRSGTFCLVDCCLVIVEQEGIENLNIQETLLELRRHRMGLIQTPDQLRFSYKAVMDGARHIATGWQHLLEEDEEEQEQKRKEEAERAERAERAANAAGPSGANDEAPPPPPPRAESLTRAPARPLPAIPASESLGNINMSAQQESSSDESPPTPPVCESSSPASSADDEDEEPQSVTGAESVGETAETLRRRRNRELATKIHDMKKRAREAEQWHSLKRSLYKPLTITFGFILAGIIIYSYVKH